MQFELDEDRDLLRSSTREFLEKEAALAESRPVMEDDPEGFSKALYAQLGDLGYLGLLLSEEDGGSGMGTVGLAAVLAEMGRVAFPGPYLDWVLAIAPGMTGGCGFLPAASASWMRAKTTTRASTWRPEPLSTLPIGHPARS